LNTFQKNSNLKTIFLASAKQLMNKLPILGGGFYCSSRRPMNTFASHICLLVSGSVYYSYSKQTCEPICKQGCLYGQCTHSDVCTCFFGYVGANCSADCKCNKHSNCKSVRERDSCTECRNNTMVSSWSEWSPWLRITYCVRISWFNNKCSSSISSGSYDLYSAWFLDRVPLGLRITDQHWCSLQSVVCMNVIGNS